MLSSTRTPTQKRQDLRALLAPGAAAPFPGAFTPLSAKLVEEKEIGRASCRERV